MQGPSGLRRLAASIGALQPARPSRRPHSHTGKASAASPVQPFTEGQFRGFKLHGGPKRDYECIGKRLRRGGGTMFTNLKPGLFSAAGVLCGILSVTAFPSPAVSGETLDAIKSANVITVGTEAHYPPMEFLEDGEIVGYGSDILAHVVADLDVELDQLELPWQGILPGILAKKFDLVATSVAITPERGREICFHPSRRDFPVHDHTARERRFCLKHGRSERKSCWRRARIHHGRAA